MEFKNWLVQEMPIDRMDFIGDWSPTAKRKWNFSTTNTKLLNNEKARDKICHMWRKLPQKINMCFVRTKEASKFQEVGEVTKSWLEQNLKIDTSDIDPEAITVFYTGNNGEPLTGWMLGHRLGHALKNTNIFIYFQNEMVRELSSIVKNVFGKKLDWHTINTGTNPVGNNNKSHYERKAFFGSKDQTTSIVMSLLQNIGTMRSARKKDINSPYEFFYELLAQYITQGKEFQPSLIRNNSIKFNDIPAQLAWGKKAWGNPTNSLYANNSEELKSANEYLQRIFPETIEYYLDQVLDQAVGKMFVM